MGEDKGGGEKELTTPLSSPLTGKIKVRGR
jgi:hypothetical protein